MTSVHQRLMNLFALAREACWRKPFKSCLVIFLAGTLLIANPSAPGADFSTVVLISPNGVGGPADRLIRSFGELLGREIGTVVIPINMPSSDLGESLIALERQLSPTTLPILVLSYSDLAKPAPSSALGGPATRSGAGLTELRFVETIASVPNVLVAPANSGITIDKVLNNVGVVAPGKPLSVRKGPNEDEVSVATPVTYVRDVEVLARKRLGGLAIKPVRNSAVGVDDVVKGGSSLGYFPIHAVKDALHAGTLKILARSGLDTLGSAEFQHPNRFETLGVDRDTPDNTWYAVFVHKNVTAAEMGRLAVAIRKARQSADFRELLSRDHSAFPYTPRNDNFEQVWRHRLSILGDAHFLKVDYRGGTDNPDLAFRQANNETRKPLHPGALIEYPPPEPSVIDQTVHVPVDANITRTPEKVEPIPDKQPNRKEWDRTLAPEVIGTTEQIKPLSYDAWISGATRPTASDKQDKQTKQDKQPTPAVVDNPAKPKVEPPTKAVYGNVDDKKLVKPPFTATPLGDPLHPTQPMTDSVKTTPTGSGNKLGGYPGLTRTEIDKDGKVQQKEHHGLDLGRTQPQQTNTYIETLTGTRIYQAPLPPRTEIATGKAAADWKQNVASSYTGTGVGKVISVKQDKNLGVIVMIEYKNEVATWGSRTMHHREALVKKDDPVSPGQIYARGAGYGDQFNKPDAGPAHVHVETYKDGQLVHLLNGAPVARKTP